MLAHPSRIEQVEVLVVRTVGLPRRVAAIRFGKNDASIYLFPFAWKREYYYGSSSFAERQSSATINYRSQETSFEKPHLSIHESGQVQVTVNRGTRAGPVNITPLWKRPTGHLATVRVDRINDLREHDGPLIEDGSKRHWPVVAPEGTESCRLVLRLRTSVDSTPPGTAFVRLESPHLIDPLFLCLEVHEDVAIGEPGRGGVTVVAGWNPTERLPEQLDALRFLFLRAD